MAYSSYGSEASSTPPARMAPHTIRNDGGGPYAVFTCEKCRQEFRSQPMPPETTLARQLGEQTVGNLLRQIPGVGEAIATNLVNSVADSLTQVGTEAAASLLQSIPVVGENLATTVAAADPRHAQTLTPAQLAAAWQQVQATFRQCPTCQRLVCQADFDPASGFCSDHRPQPAAAPAPVMAAPAPVSPAPVAPALSVTLCPSCGTDTQGAKFCPNCGAKQAPPAPTHCPSCGTEAKGARFCPNCGTKLT